MVERSVSTCSSVRVISFGCFTLYVRLYKNILYISELSTGQAVKRWFNANKKQDIHYLFNIFQRYILWYKNTPKFEDLTDKLDPYIIGGLEKLVQTYHDCEDTSVLHTL